jgi:hypothetical protein
MTNVYIEISGLTDEHLRQKKPRKDVSELRQLVWFMMVAQGERVCDICREYNFHRSTIEYAISKFDVANIEAVNEKFDRKRREFIAKQVSEVF